MTLLTPTASHTARTRGIKLIFIVHSLAGGAFITRIADFQTGLGLTEAELGLAMMSQPIGALVMNFFAARAVEKFGTKSIMLVGISLMSLLQVFVALAPTALWFGVVMAFFAATFALTNITINVEADRVEASTGQKVMSQAHGLWAFGYLATTLVGVLARAYDVSAALHFSALTLLVLAIVGFVTARTHASPPRAHKAGSGKRPFFALPTTTTLVIVLFGLSGALTEMGTRVWSVIYMRDTFVMPVWVDSLTLTAFALTIAFARMFADQFLSRMGTVFGVRILLVVAIIGLAMVGLAPHFSIALLGFGLIGIGVCVSFPLMLSTAAQTGDRPAAENVAAATLTNSVVMMASPALFGFAAQSFGIRTTFLILIPVMLVSLSVTSILKIHDQPPKAS